MEEETERCICDVCSKSFQSQQELRAHKAIHSLFQKAFKCHMCPRSFQTNQILQKHLLTHSDDRPFNCHLCEKSFKSKGSLVVHLSGHVNARSHICIYCEKGFNNTQALRRHIKIHTGEKKKEDHTRRYVECEICQQKCCRGYGMRVHMMIHTGEKPLECKTCGKRFRKKSDLRTHELTHSGVRSHVCEVCGKGFYTLSIKRKHMLSHVGQNPEKIYTKRLYSVKRRNLNDKHRGKQGTKCVLDNRKQFYKCDFCEERFKQLKTLREHIFSHDVEELKPYSCEICDKRFRQRFDFKRHMITHEERKPFMCAICETGVSTLHALRKHVERHNTNNYICESETSRSPQKYYKHQNKKDDTDNPSTQEDQAMSDTTDGDGEGYLSVKSEVTNGQISPKNCKINNAVDCQNFQIDAGIQAYMCGICSFRTCTLNILNIHIKEHEADNRPRECHVCKGIFDGKEDFDDHNCAEEIQKPKNFNCDICKTSFDNFSSLQLHECSVNDGKNPDVPQKIAHIFKCTTCKVTFPDVSTLRNHVQKHYKNRKSDKHVLTELENEPDENGMEIDEQELEDIDSGQSGNESGQSGNENDQTDEDNRTCFFEIQAPEENVDVTTGLDEKLPENKKNESNSKIAIDSEKSEMNMKDSSAVTGNNMSGIYNKPVQLKLASYSCEVCDQVFPRWKMLSGHLTSCHMLPKPFMCRMCPRTFSTTLDLRKHLSVHKSS